ncbi:hypothetical protein [Novosphingobium aquimarinum]|uniref:hypothetical protein n=1 Tax=Novosphingobium aquimarinum TaxID=2682494 RepID=UPI0012EC0E67|nr:hypothetical protein [Novosphingobium aquimarinum]
MNKEGLQIRATIDNAGHLAILTVAGGGIVSLLGAYKNLIETAPTLQFVLPWTLLLALASLTLSLINYFLRRKTSLEFDKMAKLKGLIPDANGEDLEKRLEAHQAQEKRAWRWSRRSWGLWWAAIACISVGFSLPAIALLLAGPLSVGADSKKAPATISIGHVHLFPGEYDCEKVDGLGERGD